MSKVGVATLIEQTQKQLAQYLQELQAGRSFDMAGFEQVALRIHQEVAMLKPEEAANFEKDIAMLMDMLDELQQGLETRRDSVRREIEGLNRHIDANKAYRKPESNN